VKSVADACAIDTTEAVMLRVKERCSFAYMKQHEARFAPRNEHFAGKAGMPYQVRHPDQFIRHGNVGEGVAALSEKQLETYRERFDRSLAGFPLLTEYR
jgi:hypothetical protein